MNKEPFSPIIRRPGLELRMPIATLEYAATMFEVLQRNEFFYPMRQSLIKLKSPEDCLWLITKRLSDNVAQTDAYYDIVKSGVYVGEIYARDIDYKNMTVKNLGYFVDGAHQGNGIATAAVNALTDYMFLRGIKQIYLFTHYFDPAKKNKASDCVAEKCNFRFIRLKHDAFNDILDGRAATERMYIKTNPALDHPR
ncbi:MAG: GNAT family N-acetyltransferase [Rickettsiales bacterium]|jgi:RimJ/RimL family protein N-acetyltransferase|nr:GNAT family N-acetyltransferase [Rickettsiales bacterium]